MFPFAMLALYPAFVHPSELLCAVAAAKRQLSQRLPVLVKGARPAGEA
jgi:hypothetical protein